MAILTFNSLFSQLRVVKFSVAQNTGATLFDFHAHTLCSYHMFLNLRRHQIYILDFFDFCDLCKFVCVYVFVVIKDANFKVIKSVTLARINFINNILPENQFGRVGMVCNDDICLAFCAVSLKEGFL